MFARAARRVGGWLPAEQEMLEAWLAGKAEQAAARGAPLHPVIEEFRELIDSDPIARLYLTEMIEQVPRAKPYDQRHLRSVEQMLELINAVLTEAPEFNTTELVGAPLNAILDWAMGTPAGFAAFRDERINGMFRRILRAWAEFLDSPDSLYVLNDSPSGWKCPEAMRAIGIDQYVHDPDEEHWGFASWNDFFTRRFREGERPVAAPGDDRVVVNACEATPFAIATDVKLRDRFWVKRQPYSLRDMLAGDESAEQFVGGSVYQAFLSALDYHRWHSPVSGTVRKALLVPGTYYSEAEAEGEDPAGPDDSQGFIAHVATRALIFIEADDPAIGLMCMMPVGMAEISSCVIHPHVTAGRRVEKGEEVGCFQYGGSTHCLIFRPGAIESFATAAIPRQWDAEAPPLRLGVHLATAAAG